MSYLDSGYDQFMRRQIGPNEEFSRRIEQIDQETLVPPASIDSSSIRELSLDKLRGASLTIGGKNNSFGSIIIKDNAGNSIATIDNSGITQA